MKSNPDKLDMLTSRYLSVDPTPCSNETSVAALEAQLLDEDLNLFDRYCAMFTLRNIGTDDAVKAIAKGKPECLETGNLIASVSIVAVSAVPTVARHHIKQ